ncbi:peroxisomal 2,4-dienoyl-CoA reductase-like [Papaver somniferum]|uniref:peroxisomal 2,4-dienoyl-CoA reductase-like n=1 Tax=Papaver somniferum TaxID=3469 RepID=UPI000E6FA274|nr:peroxisomal 2,4-dienoyl-CoA reductase-like [Papaver somniferum]
MESPFKVDIMKGKVALIIGGGSRIGFEITKEFGRHGASVAIMGRRKSVLDSYVSSLRSLGIQETIVRTKTQIGLSNATFQHFGRIDILVNAATGNFLVPAEDLSLNGFKAVMNIDTVGTFIILQQYAPTQSGLTFTTVLKKLEHMVLIGCVIASGVGSGGAIGPYHLACLLARQQ